MDNGRSEEVRKVVRVMHLIGLAKYSPAASAAALAV